MMVERVALRFLGFQTKQKSIGKDMQGPLVIGKSQGHLPLHSQERAKIPKFFPSPSQQICIYKYKTSELT